MPYSAILLLLFALLWSPAVADTFAESNNDGIVRLPAGDPAMAAAVRDARAGLDAFLKLAADPPSNATHFSLKVGLPIDDRNVEYVWVRPFKLEGGEFVGRLVNTPKDFPSLKYGQQILFDRANIIDWTYRDGDSLRGHFTTCVLLRKMTDAQRNAVLAENRITCPPGPV